MTPNLFTIGFTGKNAEEFFGLLRAARVTRLVDIRLHNQSQLAGFTKASDLPFLLREICGIEYEHELLLASTDEMLRAYRDRRISWDEYDARFRELLHVRKPEAVLSRERFAGACLLCSEPGPERCHRRLVVEHLAREWTDVVVEHLATQRRRAAKLRKARPAEPLLVHESSEGAGGRGSESLQDTLLK